MQINKEKPISKRSEDKLNRYKFAANLARNISSCTEENSLTIGLMGGWGSGKTSIINMMKRILEEDDKIQIIEFNPWYFSGRKQILSDFFKVLKNELYGESKVMEKLGDDLEKYSNILKPISIVPQIGEFINAFTKVLDKGSEFVKAVYGDEKDINLNKIKDEINKGLSNYEKKIVVIIDEIDRLEGPEIREVFRLVRALGDFNNIIYLLSFDQKRILDEFKGEEEYLDKIINVPIFIPELSKEKVNKIFLEEINKIIPINKDNERWKEAYTYIFKDGFKTLRELNRYLNIVKFNANFMFKEVNAIDYSIILYLKLFNYQVYRQIRDNFEVKGNYIVIETNFEDKEKNVIKVLFDKGIFNHAIEERRINNRVYFKIYFEEWVAEDVLDLNKIINLTKQKNIEKLNESVENLDINELEKLFKDAKKFSDLLNDDEKFLLLQVLVDKIKLFDMDIKSKQRELFDSLKSLNINYKKLLNSEVDGFIKKVEINEKYDIHELLKFFKSILEKDCRLKLKNIMIEKIDRYLNEGNSFYKFSILKDFDINVEEYIKKLISTEQGVINFLKNVRIVCGEEEPTPIYGEFDEIIGYDDNCEYEIVKRDISNFIDYEYVKEKVDKLSDSCKNKNKDLLNIFYNPVSIGRYELEAQRYEEYMESCYDGDK